MILNEHIIRNNYNQIMEDIKKYSPYPEKVKILFVSKYFSLEDHSKIINMGYNYFGENRAQLYRDKREIFKDEEKYDYLKWDFIGRLQKNKIKYIIDNVNLIHSVDSYELLKEVNEKAKTINRVVDVLIQINISGEKSKAGIEIEELNREYEQYFSFQWVKVRGFMTMLPFDANDEEKMSYFYKMFELKQKYSMKYDYVEELSMGMSNDYMQAIKNGATILRIGSKLFK